MLWILVVFILAALLIASSIYRNLTLEAKDHLSKTVSIVGGGVTAVSLLLTAYTYLDSASRQRELAAYSVYQKHQELSISNTKFIGISELSLKEPPTKDSPIEERREYETYKWYVGHALFSFESILQVFPEDEGWKGTFRGFFCDHEKYLNSKEFDPIRFSTEVQNLIKETFKKGCKKS